MIYGKLLGYTRLNNSVNGNPRFRVFIDIDTSIEEYVTSSDTACSYTIPNLRKGDMVSVSLTRAGRIQDIERVK